MALEEAQQEQTSSDYEGDIEEPEQSRLFGNLKTQLRWEVGSKQLHLDVRQLLETPRSLEAKFKGRLNTVSGLFAYRGLVRKNFYTNTPSIAKIMAKERSIKLEGSEALNSGRFLPAGLRTLVLKDWSMAPGISVGSGGSGKFGYVLSMRKLPQVLRRSGNLDSWVTGSANLEFDPKSAQVGASGTVRMKVYRYNVTERQDLRLSLGYDFFTSNSSTNAFYGSSNLNRTSAPYLKIEENSWAVRLQRGSWSFLYEI